LNGTGFDLVSRVSLASTELDYAQSSAGPFFMSADDPNYRVSGSHSTHALSAQRSWREGARTRATLGYDYTDREFRNEPDTDNADDSRTYRWSGTFKADAPTEIALGSGDKVSFGPSYRREETGRDSELFGAFAEWSRAREGFFGGAGVRADHHSRFGEQFSYQVGPGFRAPGFAVIARLATAFKAPSLFQLFDPSFGNRDLGTERVEGKELSVQKSLGAALLTATGFRYDYKDLIQFLGRYRNLGRARVQGAELEFNTGGETELEAAYTYTDARDQSSGAQLIRRPFHSWRLGVARSFGDRVSARAMYHGLGRRRDLDALSAAASENGAYDVLDLSVSYAPKPGVSMTVSFENVLDRNYEPVDGYGAPGAAVYAGVQAQIF
jgi:outer membrane cobalamin receptor